MFIRIFPLIFFCLVDSAYPWYFPEHALITEEGVQKTPKIAKDILARNYKKIFDSKNDKLLQLCPNFEAPFLDTRKKNQDMCIPYNTLSALAGDHSNLPEELIDLLYSNKDEISLGLRIVQGTQDHWAEVTHLKNKNPSDARRRSFIRKLDIFLTMIDSGYLTRAEDSNTHFAPADEIYSKVLNDLTVEGRVDNLLNQFILHHLRSLQYARLSKNPGKNQSSYRWIAFLEHAFALHFLEDGFASGHIVMFAPFLTPESNFNQLMRHDFFNRNGLNVSRVRSPLSCSYFRLLGDKSVVGIDDPKSVCWKTYGDGFLNKTDGYDLKWAADAVARTEVLFAIALEPEVFNPLLLEKTCNNQADLNEVFSLINPFQPWSIARETFRKQTWTCENKKFVLKKTLDSLNYLEKTPLIEEINANSNKPIPLKSISKKQVGQPFEPCSEIKDWDIDKDSIVKSKKYCPPKTAINLGKPDVSLLSGVLTTMPVPQADKKEIFGSDPFSSSLSSQLSIGFPFLANLVTEDSIYFGVNFQFGISYRLEHVIADNPNFGAAELLVGLYNAAQIGRGNPDPLTAGNFEFRTALINYGLNSLFNKIYFGIFKEGKPQYKDIVGQFDFTYSFINGFRYYTQLIQREGKTKLKAWDIEVFTLNLPLNDDIRGEERISRIPSQFRLRMGEDVNYNAFMIGIEFAVGFSRSF
jgi:hypothetical protein